MSDGHRNPNGSNSALAWALYLTSLTLATVHVAANPAWNLDGVFYSALMHPKVGSIAELHHQVYAEIEEHIPSASATALARGSRYRRQLHGSAEAFALQLPFYVNKLLYRWLGCCLTAAGVSSVAAPYAISAVCFALIGMLLPLFAIRAGAGPLAAAAVGAFSVWLPQLREVGELATPDALATALLVCGALLSLSSIRAAAIPLAAAVLARPDAAVLALAVLIAIWLREPIALRAREVLVLCAIISVLAVLILSLAGGYAWSVVMRHTFIERIVDAAGLHQSLSVRDYFDALGRGLRGHMTDHLAHFPAYLALALVSVWAAAKRGRDQLARAGAVLLGAIWGATLLRFLAMPLLAERFFMPAYVCSLALACALVFPRSSSHGGQ